jgi:voltage-gated potassium channel
MRYPPLLIALFIALLLKPFAEGTGATILPGSIFLILVFGTLIYAFRHIRRLALCLTVLGAATVTLRFLADQRRVPTLELLSQGLSFIAMVVAMVAMFSEVLRARSASSDLVMGAVCLYLIIGLAWTFFFYSIYLLSPASIFVSPDTSMRTASGTEGKFTEVLYFSFAALTTIGSSGEQALTPMVRQLAVVESAMGQLYLAVLISRLVGFSTSGDAKST